MVHPTKLSISRFWAIKSMTTPCSWHGICRECGYSLRGLADPRCPECGREFDPGDSSTFAVQPNTYRASGQIMLVYATPVVMTFAVWAAAIATRAIERNLVLSTEVVLRATILSMCGPLLLIPVSTGGLAFFGVIAAVAWCGWLLVAISLLQRVPLVIHLICGVMWCGCGLVLVGRSF